MFEVRFQYKTQILVELQKKQNLHISELVQLIFDLNIKMERFSIKIAPKHIIFDYSWDKKETNKLFRLVCLFCVFKTIEMFLRFRCLDLNTRHNHSTSLRFCFQGCLQRHLDFSLQRHLDFSAADKDHLDFLF